MIVLDAEYEFDLTVLGLYLDFQYQAMFESALFAAYSDANPGKILGKNLHVLKDFQLLFF